MRPMDKATNGPSMSRTLDDVNLPLCQTALNSGRRKAIKIAVSGPKTKMQTRSAPRSVSVKGWRSLARAKSARYGKMPIDKA